MKLNLGSGSNCLAGYRNIDKYALYEPDIIWDLERTPYPFAEADSIDEIVANHVLEHLGQKTETFLAIIQEFYRILKPGGLLDVTVPPGHGELFTGDPTHVRPIYPRTFDLFSKKKCQEWRDKQASNTPLADYLDVDFERIGLEITLNEPWHTRYVNGEITLDDLEFAITTYNGVYKQIRIMCQKIARVPSPCYFA